MSEHQPKGVATLAQVPEFDEVIDARSSAEYGLDHIPGAVSCPVLDDLQRAQIGTLYKQVSPFEARKQGAVLVARNIAGHIEDRYLSKPKDWRPLVYCWRGGKRSGAFAHILREIGWDAHRLEGGYKAWRHQLVHDLTVLPVKFRFLVVSGPTGSAKSRVLEVLASLGAQVLHLEALAAHKGSVLGGLPDEAQPSQKGFETRLHQALSRLDPTRPVFVEAESRRIGKVQVPEALIAAIRGAACMNVRASLPARVEFLLRDYAYALADPEWILGRLELLRGLHSNETIAGWREMTVSGRFPELVGALLERHYDPLYQRSQTGQFRNHDQALVFATDDLSAAGIERLAASMLSACGSP